MQQHPHPLKYLEPMAKDTADRPKKKTGANCPSRVSLIKAEHQRAVREKFQGVEYVNQLEKVAQEYDLIIAATEKATKAKLTEQDKKNVLVINMQLENLKFRLEALKAKADLNFRRLRFVLPELKSIELSDPEGRNPFADLATALREAVMDEQS